MTNAHQLSHSVHRRTWASGIRAAITTAEQVATALSRDADVGVPAQALLHRLAAIRAEVDLLEGQSRPSAIASDLKRLEEGHHLHRKAS